jgi:hypothetical protein
MNGILLVPYLSVMALTAAKKFGAHWLYHLHYNTQLYQFTLISDEEEFD